METLTIVKENWLTRKPATFAFDLTFWMSLLLFAGSFLFLTGIAGADEWMPASFDQVFNQHQYWRAWTTLFAHGDLGHLLSNTVLFIPFAYFLSGYFGLFFFPLIGFFVGGLTNLVVLHTMPPETHLIGVSGVVYWMGAAWLTLYLLIDRRESFRRRIGIALFSSVILFVPETYKPEISYLAHFVGYAFGVLSSIGLYLFALKKFEAAEVREAIEESSDPCAISELDEVSLGLY